MAAIRDFAPKIDEVILVAPDGIINKTWYNIAVYPKWGQELFRRFVENPRFVFTTARLLRTLHILHERLFKFLEVQMDTPEKRRKIYDVWLAVRSFETNLRYTKALINEYHIRSFIFIGKYDRVITKKIGMKFSHGLSNCKYIIVDKGHNLITESFNEPLKKALES
jgi:hypothetical protein